MKVLAPKYGIKRVKIISYYNLYIIVLASKYGIKRAAVTHCLHYYVYVLASKYGIKRHYFNTYFAEK